MNDHFRGLSAEERFVLKVPGKTLEEKTVYVRQAWLRNDIAMDKRCYADLRQAFSSEQTPFTTNKVLDMGEDDGGELEEALFQASKHMSGNEPINLWLAKQKLPSQKNAASLMKGLVCFDPYTGQGKNDVLFRALEWCHVVGFAANSPGIWKHVARHFDKALDKGWSEMRGQGIAEKTW